MPTRTTDLAGFPLRPVVAHGAVAVPAEIPGDGPTFIIENATAVGYPGRWRGRPGLPAHPHPDARPFPRACLPLASPHGTCPGRLPFGAAGGFHCR